MFSGYSSSVEKHRVDSSSIGKEVFWNKHNFKLKVLFFLLPLYYGIYPSHISVKVCSQMYITLFVRTLIQSHVVAFFFFNGAAYSLSFF